MTPYRQRTYFFSAVGGLWTLNLSIIQYLLIQELAKQ